MDKDFYKQIQSIFICVRFSYSRKIYEENFIRYKKSLQPYYDELKLHPHENDNYILIYCIDTLFEIINEGNCKKIKWFADTIHNMPEICMRDRPLHTFYSEISGFRSVYGNEYFPFLSTGRNELKGEPQ